MAGTNLAGETRSTRPATLSAEKPKPTKPRTMPAQKTMARLATSNRRGSAAVHHTGRFRGLRGRGHRTTFASTSRG